MVETFAGPLLPHEAAPIYNSHPSNAQAMALEKALLDIPVREHSRFVTTAIPLCQAHNHPIIERLLAAQTFPQVVLQRPVSPEADAILSLPPRLRKLIISKILHRFATVGAKDALQVDCPGLGSDSLDLLPNPDITVCCLAVGNTQVYGPTLTPIDLPTHNGHVVAYGDTSGIHEMTVALLGIDNNAFRWEKLGLGAAHDILHRALLILQQAQRLPAHRRPPHAFVISACSLKLSHFHPQSQRHWLHVLHDAYVSPLEDNRTVQLRGFSAGSYTAAVIALILANQLTPRSEPTQALLQFSQPYAPKPPPAKYALLSFTYRRISSACGEQLTFRAFSYPHTLCCVTLQVSLDGCVLRTTITHTC